MKKLSRKEFTKDLSKLVSLQTLTANIQENKIALDFIQMKISKNAIVKRIINGKAECLLASNVNTKTPDVCFIAHIDVVSSRPEQFRMTIKNGVAYGRGVVI